MEVRADAWTLSQSTTMCVYPPAPVLLVELLVVHLDDGPLETLKMALCTAKMHSLTFASLVDVNVVPIR